MTKSQEAVADIIQMASQPEATHLQAARARIERYRQESGRYHEATGAKDVAGRVRTDLATLRDAVLQACQGRQKPDHVSDLLERVWDDLTDMTN